MAASAPASCALATFSTKRQVPRSIKAIAPSMSSSFSKGEQPSVVLSPAESEDAELAAGGGDVEKCFDTLPTEVCHGTLRALGMDEREIKPHFS